METPEQWANRRYELWYKDYTRRASKRKHVQLPGTFKTQAEAGRHVAYILRKRLYHTGAFTIVRVGHSPTDVKRGFVQIFG